MHTPSTAISHHGEINERKSQNTISQVKSNTYKNNIRNEYIQLSQHTAKAKNKNRLDSSVILVLNNIRKHPVWSPQIKCGKHTACPVEYFYSNGLNSQRGKSHRPSLIPPVPRPTIKVPRAWCATTHTATFSVKPPGR